MALSEHDEYRKLREQLAEFDEASDELHVQHNRLVDQKVLVMAARGVPPSDGDHFPH